MIAHPRLPLGALRTVRCFVPCLARAIHTHAADGTEVGQATVGVWLFCGRRRIRSRHRRSGGGIAVFRTGK